MYRERQKQTEGEACHLKKWHRQKKYYIKFKDMNSEEAKKNREEGPRTLVQNYCQKHMDQFGTTTHQLVVAMEFTRRNENE